MEDEDEGVVFKKGKGTRRSRKRDDGEAEEEPEEAVRIEVKKRSIRGSVMTTTSGHEEGNGDFQYKTSGTSTATVFDPTVFADEKDEPVVSAQLQEVVDGEKIFQGDKYASFLGTPSAKSGPLKASGYIRSTTLMDYQPNVCKDYKQTGFCGYGSNCKYLHDRGDYKMGWQLEKDWNEQQKKLKDGGGGASDKDDVGKTDELPFACFICKKEFVDPVVTKCMHYFCEKCALDQEKKTRKCFICQEPTLGIFNQPKQLIEKLKQKKEVTIKK